ncbi:hypothetical protein Tco_0288530, partial [Tanacetum coccineum]
LGTLVYKQAGHVTVQEISASSNLWQLARAATTVAIASSGPCSFLLQARMLLRDRRSHTQANASSLQDTSAMT